MGLGFESQQDHASNLGAEIQRFFDGFRGLFLFCFGIFLRIGWWLGKKVVLLRRKDGNRVAWGHLDARESGESPELYLQL